MYSMEGQMFKHFLLKFLITQFLFFAGEEDSGGGSGFGGSSMDAGNGSQDGGGTPDPVSTDNGAPPAVNYQYPENLDPSFHGSKSMMKFANADGTFDYGKISQSYLQLEKHLGKDKMAIPGENSSPEEWRDTFTKMGLPESVENYSLTNTLPDGYTADESLVEGFKAKAHEMGILPNQAQGIMDFFNDFSVKGIEAQAAAGNQAQQEGFDGLKQDWGQSYEHRVQGANSALSQFASKEEIAKLNDSGLMNNPTFLQVFDKVAKGMSEDNFTPESKGTFGMSPEGAQEQIQKLFTNPAFKNKNHPDNPRLIEEYTKLLTHIHGDGKIA